MKIMRYVAIFMLFANLACAENLRLAVTTSFHNSGLADVLLPEIKADLGLDVQLLVVGTGQALRLGQAGDVDAVLVHAPERERAFVAAGHASHRRQIMYNDFVLIGPETAQSNMQGMAQVSSALQYIFEQKQSFVSRGDSSGTHSKERALWQSLALDPETFGPWYRSVGAGMGRALNVAAALDAFILSDRASWLNFGNKAGLAIAFEGDPALFNQYGYLPINPDRHPHLNSDAALALENWLTSKRAKDLINGYKLEGQKLFTFNAKD